jgi:hypothetical protein
LDGGVVVVVVVEECPAGVVVAVPAWVVAVAADEDGVAGWT